MSKYQVKELYYGRADKVNETPIIANSSNIRLLAFPVGPDFDDFIGIYELVKVED